MTKRIEVGAIAPIVGTSYPSPFDQPCRKPERRRLGDAAGLNQFGVNLLRLPPGAWSSQRHWHTGSDEFVYVLSGEVLLDPELDVVLEDSRGRFLSYCIGWLDVANALGHFEPVGCRPDFTGRGYARAVTIEGLRRMQARGMRIALVGTEGINERARVLYPSCGFVEVDRAYFYVKPVSTR